MESKIIETASNNNIYFYLGYIVAGIVFFFKSFKASFDFIKGLFKKEEKSSAGTSSDISINIGTDITQNKDSEFTDSQKKEVRYLLTDQNNVLDLIFRLQCEIISSQLKFYDSRMLTIKVQAEEIMTELLKDADIDVKSPNNYFADFENFMEIVGKRVKRAFKGMCLINGFDKQSPAEFRETIKRNISQIDGIILELLRKRYPQKDFIKNFNKFDNIYPSLHEILEDCFNNAKDVSEKKKNRVATIKKEFEEQASTILSKTYSVDY